ncbi:DUF3761 domain-containing protein [Mycobacterium simiae]|uniref:DUF3761 domain-containing protein n=1 Tax=Mycobacterium simiae TaxID=1784 RepID=A0A1X0XY56_MYCSI|nr:DUF3761 domain-containing protein [Mycobacterium simiae]ORJ57782.1 hypothetical protein B5M45_19425 [Mycobacterium simiae]
MFRAFVGAAAAAATIGLPLNTYAVVGLVGGPGAIARSPIPLSQCLPGYYPNSYGVCVERPDQNPGNPTALCCDGSESHSQHRSGTCSGHGGVCQWNSIGSGYAGTRTPQDVRPWHLAA